MTEAKKQVVLMKGIGVSSGIVIGQVYIMERGIIEPSQYCYLEASETEKEIERFEQAVQLSRDQLLRIKKKMEKDGRGKEHILIIDAHLMILQDNMLINDTIKVIKKERVNAEWAIKSVLKDIKEYFDKMDDSYLRDSSMDIEQIVKRVLLNLLGRAHESVADLKTPVIVIARDLTPADTAQRVKGTVLGVLTGVGGRTSHTSIMARSLEIPAIGGLENITRKAEMNDTIIVDGTP